MTEQNNSPHRNHPNLHGSPHEEKWRPLGEKRKREELGFVQRKLPRAHEHVSSPHSPTHGSQHTHQTVHQPPQHSHHGGQHHSSHPPPHHYGQSMQYHNSRALAMEPYYGHNYMYYQPYGLPYMPQHVSMSAQPLQQQHVYLHPPQFVVDPGQLPKKPGHGATGLKPKRLGKDGCVLPALKEGNIEKTKPIPVKKKTTKKKSFPYSEKVIDRIVSDDPPVTNSNDRRAEAQQQYYPPNGFDYVPSQFSLHYQNSLGVQEAQNRNYHPYHQYEVEQGREQGREPPRQQPPAYPPQHSRTSSDSLHSKDPPPSPRPRRSRKKPQKKPKSDDFHPRVPKSNGRQEVNPISHDLGKEGITTHSVIQLAHMTGLIIGKKKEWRYRDVKRSLMSKLTDEHKSYIESTSHSMLTKRLPHRLSLLNFVKRISLMVFHFFIRDGRPPRFWKEKANKDVFKQELEAHDPDFMRKVNLKIAMDAHKLVQNGNSVHEAIEAAQRRYLASLQGNPAHPHDPNGHAHQRSHPNPSSEPRGPSPPEQTRKYPKRR